MSGPVGIFERPPPEGCPYPTQRMPLYDPRCPFASALAAWRRNATRNAHLRETLSIDAIRLARLRPIATTATGTVSQRPYATLCWGAFIDDRLIGTVRTRVWSGVPYVDPRPPEDYTLYEEPP